MKPKVNSMCHVVQESIEVCNCCNQESKLAKVFVKGKGESLCCYRNIDNLMVFSSFTE